MTASCVSFARCISSGRAVLFRIAPLCLLAITVLFAACGKDTASQDSPEDAPSDTAQVTQASAPAPLPSADLCDPDNGGLTLPEGFCAKVVADTLGETRHLAVSESGDIYAALRSPRNGNGMVALRDTSGDLVADRIEYFGEDVGGTGIGIHKGHLYFGPDTAIWRYEMSKTAFLPTGDKEVIVSGFLEQRSHAVKPFAFDGQGNMYVNVGAPSNACQEPSRTAGAPGQDPCPQLERQAGVWQFSDDTPNQTQMEDGERYATGIRNAVAIAWNDVANNLYVMQHGRDQLHSLWPELYTQEESAELPGEEFFKVDEGDDFGWPYCYYDWKYDQQKELAPEYGGDGTEVGRCSEKEAPLISFPGHWAPNDLLFYNHPNAPESHRGDAMIAFHGSWNRSPFPQQGYNIGNVPMDGATPVRSDSTGWAVFARGFANQDTIDNPSQAEYRPTGLALGPDGSIYIADDAKGRIWRVWPVEPSEATNPE
ncbi:sorbosone dehydrogenase [Longibacter salinarum]|uniref:Sorbosone dehydrogenase n=1 Tax=Longibacter salinarum TaxID=1850348 RepID=A0A2A8CXY7_9BACT|nr:PQQ-dependent sugar dehydrogenase [Longibacter salinarum]PEN13464.1 sorbosone dehydrogenase [Longibacter salinarum]